MAKAISAIFVPPTSLVSSNTRKINLSSWNDKLVIHHNFPFRTPKYQSRKPPSFSGTNGTVVKGDRNAIELPMSIDALQRFIRLNLGNWTGSFHQFDGHDTLMHKIATKLAVGFYGEGELMSLLQTLYIKQPQSTTSFSGDDDEPEWFEYKIKETNMFTVDKYQQRDSGRRLLLLRVNCSSRSVEDAETESESKVMVPNSTSVYSSISAYNWCAALGGIGFLETSYLTYLKLTNSEAFCCVGDGGSCGDILNNNYRM